MVQMGMCLYSTNEDTIQETVDHRNGSSLQIPCAILTVLRVSHTKVPLFSMQVPALRLISTPQFASKACINHAKLAAHAEAASSSSFFTCVSSNRCMSFEAEVEVGLLVEGST